MSRTPCQICRWLLKAVGFAPDLPDQYALDVDYSLSNDTEVRDADAALAEVEAAANRLTDQPSAAFGDLLRLAQAGSTWAMIVVGDCVLSGTGADLDRLEAEKWYGSAARAGSQRGLLGYGAILENRGDLNGAAEIYRSGVEQGWAPALFASARLELRRDGSSKAWRAVRPMLQLAADGGSLSAALFLSRSMSRGRYGWGNIIVGYLQGMRLARDTSDQALEWAKMRGLAS